MFPAIALPYRMLFGALLLVWGLLFVTGMIGGRYNADCSRRLPPVNKLLMSVTLIIIGVIWWLAFARLTPLAPYGAWITVGMFFGLLGDVSLADVLPLKRPIPLGMLAFGVGHILYIVGYGFLGRRFGLSGKLLPAAVGVALIVAIVSWRFTAWNPRQDRVLSFGALGYTILLCSMAGVAMWLALEDARLAWLAVGAVLFVISDMLLACYLFRRYVFRSIRDLVWVLYTVGQALIVLSIGTAVQMV